MLTITFLGVGSAFAKRNFHSNALIEAWSKGPDHQQRPEDTLLVDFGGTGPLALYHLKDKPGFSYLAGPGGMIHYPSIHRIFITHQHSDHIGGLEELALMNTYYCPPSESGKPFKPQIISSISVLVNLWDTSLKGGLSIIQGRYALLQDYFFIMSLKPGDPEKDRFTMLRRYRFRLFATDHVQIERKYDWPSYGLFIEDGVSGESAFFSGDTRFDWPAYAGMMERSRINFHDVQLTKHRSTVHAMIDELRTMPASVKRRTWLYHYGDEWDSGPYDFVRDEFAGFAPAQERMLLLP